MVRDNKPIDTVILSRGGLLMSPTAAPIHRTNELSGLIKVVTMKFYTGTLLINNPNAHLYLMTDGYIDASIPRKSLQGRGVAIGHTSKGEGISCEKFGAEEFMVGEFIPAAFQNYEFYDIMVVSDEEMVSWNIHGPNVAAYGMTKFGGDYASNDTAIGVAGNKNPDVHGMFNVLQRRYKYLTYVP